MNKNTTGASTTVVEYLIGRLHGLGCQRLFGVPGGGSSLDMINAARAVGMEFVLTRREDAAMIMAGVTALLSAAPGLALSTKGPGVSSAVNGVASAALDRMPALFVAEDFEHDEQAYLSHQVFAQNSLVAPVTKTRCRLQSGDQISAIDQQLAAMYSPPYGPAYLTLTSASARASCRHDIDDAAPFTLPVIGQAEDAVLAPALACLQKARRPLVIAGLEATRPGIAAALRRLIDVLHAPALVTYMAKGVVPDEHPCFAGIFTGGAIEQRCVNEADLIILVGLDPVELIRKPWAYSAPVLDIAHCRHQPHYMQPEAAVYGAIAPALARLTPQLTGSDWRTEEIAEHRNRFLHGMALSETAGLDAEIVIKAAREAFMPPSRPAPPRLAVDAGAHMFSALAFWPCHEPLDVLISNGLATMGFAVPAALAAALEDPGRGAIAVTGDGGVLMCLGELATAANRQADMTIVVLNDGALSLIDIKRRERQMPELGLSWERPDFAAIARGFALPAWRATDRASLAAALAQAAATSGPCLVDVVINPDAYLDQMRVLRG